jgi:transposase
MNTNLIHKWLRDPKFAPDPAIIEDEVAETPCFLPVEIVERTPAQEAAPTADTKPAQSAIEIDIAGGHQLRIVGSYDPEALARLIRGLFV